MGRKRKADQQQPVQEPEQEAAPAALSESLVGNLDVVVQYDEDGGIRIEDMYIPPAPPPALTFDTTKPRLVITNIELHNFKSYAGVKVLGPFCKSFTAIVGPNGSGKSNVIDAMLFVFGYRAQKIRCKKVSVLIHSSDEHNNLPSCSVSVNFQQIVDRPGEECHVIQGSQLLVSRTACRDNSSYYEINGKKCMFRDVATLLRQHGIDLDHNRFLILQGEVEQIALMKSKAQNEHETGMLEYLEDIVGSTRLKEPIEHLSRIVETLNNIRNEKMQRLKILAKEKDDLAVDRAKAIEFLERENKVAKMNGILYQKHIYDSTCVLETNSEKLVVIEKQLKEMVEKLQNLASKSQEREAAISVEFKELKQRSKRKEDLGADFNKMEKACVKIVEDMKYRNEQRKKNQRTLEEEKKKLEEYRQVPARNTTDIEHLTSKKEKLLKDQKKAEEELTVAMTGLRAETQELQDQKEVQENKLLGLQKDVNETKSAFDIAQSELDLYLSQEKAEKRKLEDITANLQDAKNKLAESKRQVKDITTRMPVVEENLQKANNELKDVVAEAVQKEAELRRRQMEMEEVRSAAQMAQNKGKVLSALLEQKSNGNLPGIFGRMGDLGAIDAKYDVAVSTACPALENIVVDTVDTAQQCIEFLKHNNIGKATFIALEKQEHLRRHCHAPFQAPENAPRLFDLVRVENEQVRTAFYFALGNTLVASDLTQAMRIAYGTVRHRVVTLTGELIETSGTMSGGGRNPCRGRMGRSVVSCSGASSPADIQRMQKQVEEVMRRAAALRERQGQLEEEIPRLTRELQKLKFDLEKYKMELQRTGEQEKRLTAQLEQQEANVKEAMPDENKVKELEVTVKNAKSAYEKASAKTEKIQAEVNRLHTQIVQITEGKLKPAQNKLATITKQADKVAKDIVTLSVGIKTAQRNTAKSEASIQELEQDVEEACVEIQAMKERREVLDKEGQVLLVEIEKLTKEIAEFEEKVHELQRDKHEVVTMENNLKKEVVDVENEKGQVVQKNDEARAEISGWEKKFKRLRVHNLETDEDVPVEKVPVEEVKNVKPETLTGQITVLLEEMRQNQPNLAVIAEYRKKEDAYIERVAEMESITKRRDAQRKQYDDLRKQRLNEFMTAFTIVTSKLKEVYQMITLGGDAELELVDSLDPFSEGILFSVRPPKKSWKHISHLSGGEKTLASLGLVFALHYYKPSPLYVMDEIDAALDFKNVFIVANYVKEQTKNAQFIIISLRSNMFEEAERLVGIYKTYNCSKSVTINPKAVAEQCKALSAVQSAMSKEGAVPKVIEATDNGADDVQTENLAK